ncbi:cytochrome c3 family protein [Deferrisoma palaeochoriense]
MRIKPRGFHRALVTVAGAALLSAGPAAAFDHGQLEALYNDPETGGANVCRVCHPEAVESFKASVHYTSRSVVENENFFFPGGGKHGMLDRACALVGSPMLLNMLGTSYTSVEVAAEQGGTPGQQCGSCHTNYYNTLFEGFLTQQFMGMEMDAASAASQAEQIMLSGVDCLVCHAEEYDFRIRTTYEPDPYGLNMGFGTLDGVPQRIKQDRSAEALASIVRTPTDEMCLRCHEHGRTDYKRGELPEAEYDIHYKLGVSSENPCLFCHEATDHKFNRGPMVNGDLFASDYPVNSDENDASCAGCHTDRPHSSDRLNDHVEKIACETCHITWTSGAETTIWGDGGFLALAKGKDNRPVKLYTKKEGGQPLTNEELWENYHQRPIYMPFSGLTSFLAQPLPVTNPATGEAPRIYPFKTIINPLPFDGRFFGIGVDDVDRDRDGVNDYSMFAAMRMFAEQYKMLGFMDQDFDFSKFQVDEATGMVVTTVDPADPAYPGYAAMAQMAAFPNMLFFDKYTFGYNWYQDLGKLAEAGKITTWDEAYRPLAVKDMRKAVEVGMSRLLDMMLQMGFDPTEYGMTAEQMKAMYSKDALSADQVVVMAAPPGSEMQMMLSQMGVDPALWQNYPAYSNGVTLGGHGVRKDDALMCADCHDAERSVFNQKVEVPTYGPNGLPLVHWEFYSKELLEKAEAGEIVEDVWEAGYALASDDFEMGGPFVTASQAAEALGITFGLDGDYIAVLVPTTRLATNWEVLGYSAARIAELTGTSSEEAGGVIPGDVESDEAGSSECFVQALGGEVGPLAGLSWLLAAAAAGLGLTGRKR